MRTIEVRVVSANAFPVCIVCVRAHKHCARVCELSKGRGVGE